MSNKLLFQYYFFLSTKAYAYELLILMLIIKNMTNDAIYIVQELHTSP